VVISPPQGMGAANGDANANKLIKFSLDSFPMPTEENAEIKLPYGNEFRYVAGMTTFSDETLVIKDFCDIATSSMVDKWRRAVYDPDTGEIGLAKNYKCDGEVWMFGPGGIQQFCRKWKLWGVWPKSVKFGEGKMGDATDNKITIVLKVDKITFLGQQGATNA